MKIPYGKGSLEFSLPKKRVLGILQNRVFKGRDIGTLLTRSLTGPVIKKLRKDVSGKRVLIAVPDNTRHAHLKKILPKIVKDIEGAAGSIRVVIATGLHKKHSRGDLEDLVGPAIASRHKAFSHDHDSGTLVHMGDTPKGVPVVLNKAAAESDFIISVGVIEPHLYAGYSGGAKTVAIGLAGEDTINTTHGIRFLSNPKTRLGSTEDNPFQDTLWDIVRFVPLKFSVNVVNNYAGEPAGLFCGETSGVFRDGVNFARKVFEVSSSEPADMVICGVGYPKDVNLYQSSRAVNYVANTDHPVLKKGGAIIVVSELRDGAGEGMSEKRFYDELKKMSTPAAFLNRVSKDGFLTGAHRAYMVAGAMINYKIIFVTKSALLLGRGMPFPFFASISDAVSHADAVLGKKSKIYVIPHALSSIAGLS